MLLWREGNIAKWASDLHPEHSCANLICDSCQTYTPDGMKLFPAKAAYDNHRGNLVVGTRQRIPVVRDELNFFSSDSRAIHGGYL
jgi:hypothetical protein